MNVFTVQIPADFRPTVVSGKRVDKGDILAELDFKRRKTAAPIAIFTLLQVKPKAALRYLRKRNGETIKKGEIIAQKKGLFATTRIKSPVSGRLEVIANKPGYIRIVPLNAKPVLSPVAGVVRSVKSNSQLRIETEHTVITAAEGWGSGRGVLFKLADSGNIFSIDRKVAGKIVVGVRIDAIAATKIKALGAAGLVTNQHLELEELGYLVVKRIDVLEHYLGKKAEILNNGGHYLIIS